ASVWVAANSGGIFTTACKKSSTPRMTALASPFFVTTNRSRLPETRSRICPNWVRAMNAGKLLVTSFLPRAATTYLHTEWRGNYLINALTLTYQRAAVCQAAATDVRGL